MARNDERFTHTDAEGNPVDYCYHGAMDAFHLEDGRYVATCSVCGVRRWMTEEATRRANLEIEMLLRSRTGVS